MIKFTVELVDCSAESSGSERGHPEEVRTRREATLASRESESEGREKDKWSDQAI